MMLARPGRSGDLKAVRVPGRADEAVRDLVRGRDDAVRECRNGRHRLKALLLRNGITYAGKSAWTAAHMRWLATLKMQHAAQRIGFQEYLHSISEATTRIARLEQAMRDTLADWTLKPLDRQGTGESTKAPPPRSQCRVRSGGARSRTHRARLRRPRAAGGLG